MNNTGHKDIWVFAEQQNGKLMNVAFELLGEGQRLANETKDDRKVCALLMGYKTDGLVKELYSYGADIVYVADDELLEFYNGEAFSKVLMNAVGEYNPDIILLGATNMGNELASRLADKTETGMASNCVSLEIDTDDYLKYLKGAADIDINDVDASQGEGLLKQTRPGDDDLMTTIITPRTKPQIATVNPGVMDKSEQDSSLTGTKIEIDVDFSLDDLKVKLIEAIKDIKEIVSLTEANIVCAAGRGLGDADGFKLIQEFADKVGGAVGASRFAVDSGWIDLPHQVGQSGTYVRPKIYFACGISGAIQHIVGMQNSDTIVAINKNPDAPIMQIADFAIVGDLYKIIPQIIEVWDDYK